MKNLTKPVKIKRKDNEPETDVQASAVIRFDTSRNVHVINLSGSLDRFYFSKAYALRDLGRVEQIIGEFTSEFETAYQTQQKINALMIQHGFSVVSDPEIDSGDKEKDK